jgi:integrase
MPCGIAMSPRIPAPARSHPKAYLSETFSPHNSTSRHPTGLIVRFAAYTGLRAGELAALRIRPWGAQLVTVNSGGHTWPGGAPVNP